MATVKKPIKKAQVGDTLKKPTIDMYSSKNYDLKKTTYPGGDSKTETTFKPTAKFDIPSVTKKKAQNGAKTKPLTDKESTDMFNAAGKIKKPTVKKLPSDIKKAFPTAKAKDGKWMQKAAASIKRRGTEGKCTPITKPGCTGKAKALAKTFKKIAKSNKKK